MKQIVFALLACTSIGYAQETWVMIPIQERIVYQTLITVESVTDSVQLAIDLPARSSISAAYLIVDLSIADVDSIKLGIRGHGQSPGNILAYDPGEESGNGAQLNFDGSLYGTSMTSGVQYVSGSSMQRIVLHIKPTQGGVAVGTLRIILVVHQY